MLDDLTLSRRRVLQLIPFHVETLFLAQVRVQRETILAAASACFSLTPWL
jgi:hypothetical protein